MRLFIAEKPELARALATGIDGKFETNEGYFKKGDNIITWGFGHMLELYMPEDYNEDYKKWELNNLPLEIEEFKYKPIVNSKKQLKIICNLINDKEVKEIVNCGDADEEGQILIDEIIDYSKTNKPVFRILLQDLTEKGIRKSLKEIKPNSEFKGLSESGFARSQADWIVGINLTRALTKKAQSFGHEGVLSLGRVQTPILGLIVARDKEHENHKSSFYYTISANFNIKSITINTNLKVDEKITDEKLAQKILDDCLNQKLGLLTKCINEEKKEYAPLPYNLLILQSDCSEKFGYKPDKTLEITQSLREKYKLITYNRSDCQYLPENLFKESPEILTAVKTNFNNANYSKIISNADTSIKSFAFNDKNITAHYGIIPTCANVDINLLNKDELNVYDLICKRFIAQFYPPKEFLNTKIEIELGQYVFTTSKNKILKTGYTSIIIESKKAENDDEAENDIDLSELVENKEAILENIKSDKKKTKPKDYYTISSLLTDIASVSKYVEDERIKQLLKEKDKGKKGENGGIGTPATRSEHIKTLFEREYIREEKKKIISTQKGRDLISVAPKILTTPDMTALWFEEQKDIMNGNLTKDEFLKDINLLVSNEISIIKSDENSDKMIAKFSNSNKKENSYPCKCGGVLIRRKNQNGNYFWGCSNWKNGCKEIYFDKNGKPDIPKYFCPLCGQALIRFKSKNSNSYYWGCKGYSNGCKVGFIKDISGKPEKYKKD
jgi:DNA topoisomerase-3